MKCVALIVTHNRLEKLKNTIKKTAEINFSSVVVVNNGSTDGTSGWLSACNAPRLIIINTERNTGGAGGFRAGSEYICRHLNDTDWVFFYDDDAWPESNILQAFSHLVTSGYRVFASSVHTPGGIPCRMNLPFKKIPGTLKNTLIYLTAPGKYLPDTGKATQVETVSFTGMVISRDVLQEHLRDIHDEFFLYYDDLFFGYALTSSGKNIRYSPELRFTHDISIQNKIIYPEWKVYYLCRNLLLTGKVRPGVRIFGIPAIAVRLVKYLALLPWQRNKCHYLYSVIRGIIHGAGGIRSKNH
ncbi:TPA: glycosyltransferase [Salmonella enterica subsp. enterica serovar Welikade]|nr:glycosyltransferase family 2 protein [Salmonella enterica subsp. enterica serovar Poona]EGB0326523.1 glycosyltransferase [Salmonella enterica]HEC8684657.1 glycosyltransferase [Salmonella enterica subsp. enterica serovar Oranienburg]EKB5038713.1 glycosyltransferase [Salmonella enterica]EME1064272.1 glycosyltransferase [Salmonella enterica]